MSWLNRGKEVTANLTTGNGLVVYEWKGVSRGTDLSKIYQPVVFETFGTLLIKTLFSKHILLEIQANIFYFEDSLKKI